MSAAPAASAGFAGSGSEACGARDGGGAGGARGLIAQCAGNAFGAVPALAQFIAGLFAAHRGLLRIVILVGFFGHREVQIGRDRRAHAPRPDHRFQQFDDAPLVAFLELARVLELPGAGGRVGVLVGRVEQGSRLIHQGHIAGG